MMEVDDNIKRKNKFYSISRSIKMFVPLPTRSDDDSEIQKLKKNKRIPCRMVQHFQQYTRLKSDDIPEEWNISIIFVRLTKRGTRVVDNMYNATKMGSACHKN